MATENFGLSMYDTQEYRLAQQKRNKELRAALDTMPIKETKMTDFTKPVQTRSGLPVTIITTEGRGSHKVIGYMDDEEDLSYWLADGKFFKGAQEDECDLINVPEKRVMLVHFIQTPDGNVFPATVKDESFSYKHIATKRVEYTEGQFDD